MDACLVAFFQKKRWPDAQLRVSWTAESSAVDSSADGSNSGDSARELRLPAHRILLANSEVFEAQLLRWSEEGSEEAPTIKITITSKQQLTGLLAAVAVLYGNEDLLRQVAQQDLVSAVVYGDQLAIPRAVELGMQLLKQVAAADGTTPECRKALAALPTWPTCMLPLVRLVAAHYDPQCAAEQQQVFQKALVAALGDLEAVWEDEQLQEQLLALPLPATELLLSSDQLRVVSEDTVLYTALRYVQHIDSIQGRVTAKEALSKCIRCVRLSQRNLLALATTADRPLFSREQQELLLQVLALCLVSTEHCIAALAACSAMAVPTAWLQPQRMFIVSASPKSMVWWVQVAEIKAACRAAAAGLRRIELQSSSIIGPVCGLAFRVNLQAEVRGNPAGSCLGFFFEATCMSSPAINLSFKVTTVNTGHSKSISMMLAKKFGWPTYFGIPPMAGDGWDEAAWLAKGLPLEGHLELQLTVAPLDHS